MNAAAKILMSVAMTLQPCNGTLQFVQSGKDFHVFGLDVVVQNV